MVGHHIEERAFIAEIVCTFLGERPAERAFAAAARPGDDQGDAVHGADGSVQGRDRGLEQHLPGEQMQDIKKPEVRAQDMQILSAKLKYRGVLPECQVTVKETLPRLGRHKPLSARSG